MITPWYECSAIFGSRLPEYWLLDTDLTLPTEKLIIINIYMQLTSIEWLHQTFDPKPELKARMRDVTSLLKNGKKKYLFGFKPIWLWNNDVDKLFKALRGWLISHIIFTSAASVLGKFSLHSINLSLQS